jgi:ABC-type proline/glycine betaine transport system ATPase subunit
VLKITDRSYLIKDGQVRTHGTPMQIVRDPIAIKEYLGSSMADTALSQPAPAPTPTNTVRQILEAERIHRTIELLCDNAAAPAAVAELVQRGRAVVPDLLAALDRREAELRRRAYMVLQHICGVVPPFDPFAGDGQRRQQIAVLRQHVLRLPQAG